MSELKVVWKQTRTQLAIEREYRKLASISEYLEKLVPHETKLSELKHFEALQCRYSVEKISLALKTLTSVRYSGPRSLKMAYLRKNITAVLKSAGKIRL